MVTTAGKEFTGSVRTFVSPANLQTPPQLSSLRVSQTDLINDPCSPFSPSVSVPVLPASVSRYVSPTVQDVPNEHFLHPPNLLGREVLSIPIDKPALSIDDLLQRLEVWGGNPSLEVPKYARTKMVHSLVTMDRHTFSWETFSHLKTIIHTPKGPALVITQLESSETTAPGWFLSLLPRQTSISPWWLSHG